MGVSAEDEEIWNYLKIFDGGLVSNITESGGALESIYHVFCLLGLPTVLEYVLDFVWWKTKWKVENLFSKNQFRIDKLVNPGKSRGSAPFEWLFELTFE